MSGLGLNKIYRKKAEDDSIVAEAYKRNPVVCHSVSPLSNYSKQFRLFLIKRILSTIFKNMILNRNLMLEKDNH